MMTTAQYIDNINGRYKLGNATEHTFRGDLTQLIEVEKFISRLNSNFIITQLGKLEKFYEHDFKSFVGELKKQKVTLSLKDQDEWEDYFNTYKQEINTIEPEITKTDKKIDKMVYELYGLNDEIRVVENG
jgi:hypothetical protein